LLNGLEASHTLGFFGDFGFRLDESAIVDSGLEMFLAFHKDFKKYFIFARGTDFSLDGIPEIAKVIQAPKYPLAR